jgi:hypothetical protein
MSEEKDTEEVFVIQSVPKFADELRDSVIYQMIDSGELPKPESKNMSPKAMNKYITVSQVVTIIRDNLLSINEDNDFIIDMDCFDEIYFRVCDNIHGSMISKLASDGVIESAFDDEKNKFVFWFAG